MSLFRSTLESVRAYVPTPSQPGHRLHLNESPADLPPEVKASAVERLLAIDWSRYPEETEQLTAALAQADGWRADGVLVGNGSNELLQTTMLAALTPGDAIVLAAPSFSLYATQARVAGARLVEVPLRSSPGEPFRFDVDRFIDAARDARLVLIATPNNPTGTPLSLEDVRRLHDRTRCLVVVDEAYRHFGKQDLAPLLADCERLMLLRTFSKSYAAAGLRLGYALASPAICVELRKVMMPYNAGVIGTALALELLRRPALVEERTAFVIRERDRIASELTKMPRLRVEHSVANFVVIEHEVRLASELSRELARRGVLVRDLTSYAGCERCLRVSVGAIESNDALISAMRELV